MQSVSRNRFNIDLVKQMAECDANYIRLLKLIPGLYRYRSDFNAFSLQGTVAEFSISDQPGRPADVRVKISVLEAFKYTTTLKIEQKPNSGHWAENPAMEVRVYHDANTAEVIACSDHRNFEPRYSLPNPKMYQRDEKFQVNHFLGEWLSHCLAVGRSSQLPELVLS